MPIYEYRCENGHLFEVMQKITEDPVTECEVCGAPVQRVFHPIAVHFKGSGFYNTDYGTARRKREMDKSASRRRRQARRQAGREEVRRVKPASRLQVVVVDVLVRLISAADSASRRIVICADGRAL